MQGAHAFRASLRTKTRQRHPSTPQTPDSFDKNRLGWEDSRHSNRHALRNTIERKVRSKIR